MSDYIIHSAIGNKYYYRNDVKEKRNGNNKEN